jgi:hypothetical protein
LREAPNYSRLLCAWLAAMESKSWSLFVLVLVTPIIPIF